MLYIGLIVIYTQLHFATVKLYCKLWSTETDTRYDADTDM